jgi:tripartite-type tricarboxylate transporter receptor subunit TctC
VKVLRPPWSALSRIARAQAYPTRPVRIIVGFAPGGATDIMARLIGQWLSERLGQQFVIENRPGAGGNLGTEAVVRAPADGYTLLAVTVVNAINATLYEKLSFNFIRDVAPVAGIHREPKVMKVNPSVPVKTVPEFIAHAKANPGKINMASGGIGVPSHVSGELFKMMTGVNLVHVPYRGAGPGLVDLLGKEINAALADPKFKARLADLGGTALTGSPADFAKLIADETEKWGKVVKFVGIKAD